MNTNGICPGDSSVIPIKSKIMSRVTPSNWRTTKKEINVIGTR